MGFAQKGGQLQQKVRYKLVCSFVCSFVTVLSFISCRVRWFLRKAEQDFQKLCWRVEGTRQCCPTAFNLPWTEIIMACVQYRMTGLRTLLADSQVLQRFRLKLSFFPCWTANGVRNIWLVADWIKVVFLPTRCLVNTIILLRSPHKRPKGTTPIAQSGRF